MQSQHVQIGKTYAVKARNGQLVPATIIDSWVVKNGNLRFLALNEITGREKVIKSADKLRFQMVRNQEGKWVKIK